MAHYSSSIECFALVPLRLGHRIGWMQRFPTHNNSFWYLHRNIAWQIWYLIRSPSRAYMELSAQKSSQIHKIFCFFFFFFYLSSLMLLFCCCVRLWTTAKHLRVPHHIGCASWRCVKTQTSTSNAFVIIITYYVFLNKCGTDYRVYASLRLECIECEGADMQTVPKQYVWVSAIQFPTSRVFFCFVCWTWGI